MDPYMTEAVENIANEMSANEVLARNLGQVLQQRADEISMRKVITYRMHF